MTTFNWQITSMDCYPQEGGNSDVVFTVHWTCTGQQDSFSSSIYAATSIPTPEGQFTPYANLTQDQVLGWIWINGADKDITEAAVQQQIDDQINPPVVTLPLPWVAA